jgi:hypothetical protein
MAVRVWCGVVCVCVTLHTITLDLFIVLEEDMCKFGMKACVVLLDIRCLPNKLDVPYTIGTDEHSVVVVIGFANCLGCAVVVVLVFAGRFVVGNCEVA